MRIQFECGAIFDTITRMIIKGPYPQSISKTEMTFPCGTVFDFELDQIVVGPQPE